MIKHRIILGIAAMLFVLSGCSKEAAGTSDKQGETVELRIALPTKFATRATDEGTDEDNRISHFRVLAYESSTGQLAYDMPVNLIKDGGDPGRLVGMIEIEMGKYDFVFLANVNAATVPIPAGDNISNLANYTLRHGLFSNAYDIPMISEVYEQVVVQGNNEILLKGETVSAASPWVIDVERIGVKLSLEFKLTSGQKRTLNYAYIRNIPSNVYLLPGKYNDGTYGPKRAINGFSMSTDVDENGMYTFSIDRIILPESIFADATDKTKGVVIGMDFSDGLSRTAVIGIDPGTDYTLPRNKFVKISGDINDQLTFSITVTPWGDPLLYPVE